MPTEVPDPQKPQVSQSELDADTVKTILSEYKIHNADVTLRCDATSDDLIDVIEGNRIYIPCIYVLNKIDQISIEARVSPGTPLCPRLFLFVYLFIAPLGTAIAQTLVDVLEKKNDGTK